MKTNRLLLAVLLLAPALSWAQEKPEKAVPEAFPKDRYARLVTRSPFAPASSEAPAEVAPDFAQNLYITGVAKLGNKDCVFIASRDQTTKFALFGHDPSPDGITLESIEWSPIVGKSRVVLKKGGQIGTVSYDEALVRAALPPPAQANANPDGEAPRPGLFPRPPGQNFNRGGTNGQGPNGNFQRRRTRIIGGGSQ